MSTTAIATPPIAVRNAAIRGQSFPLLVRTEVRKAVDTRSGRIVLAGILLLSLGALVYHVVRASAEPVTYEQVFGGAVAPVLVLLPVVGILAMTGEWTQRTALTTFTLSPRRVRVLVAKFVSALVLSVVVVSVVASLAAVATVLAGQVGGGGATFDDMGRIVGGALVINALNVVMGAAFGAVMSVTAVAVLAFYIAPNVWGGLAPQLLKERADWLDIFAAFTRIAEFRLGDDLPQTVTAVTAWVLVPLVAGLFFASRREVK